MAELGMFETIFGSRGAEQTAQSADRVANSVNKVGRNWEEAAQKAKEARQAVGTMARSAVSTGLASYFSGASPTQIATSVAGSLAGQLVGATVGSLAGPVGTIAGEVLGGIVGAVVGDAMGPIVGDAVDSLKDSLGFMEIEKATDQLLMAQSFSEIARAEREAIQAAYAEAGAKINVRRAFGVPVFDKEGFVEERSRKDVVRARQIAQIRRNEFFQSNPLYQQAREQAGQARGESALQAQIEATAARLSNYDSLVDEVKQQQQRLLRR